MPEGPSIVILKEAVQQFKGKRITDVWGNTKKIDVTLLKGKKIIDFKSWGKHFLIVFKDFSIRIHFMLFGSYRINEHKDADPRLHLSFTNGELNFYTCSIIQIDEPLDEVYDWTADVMNEQWDEKKALQKLKVMPEALVCDVLLNQDIFAGVGNIIKNEVLFRVKVHPASKVGNLQLKVLKLLIREAVIYSFQFYEWKKEYTLKKHWLAYHKKICPRDNIPFMVNDMGKTKRKTYYCNVCMELY